LPKLTKSMAAPRTAMLRLKLRSTGEDVDAEIKLLSAVQIGAAFHKNGIRTANEFMRLKDLGDLKIIEASEIVAAEALSVSERWTVNDVRNAFERPEMLKIVEAVSSSLPSLKSAGKPQVYG
jgi:hypothetical protein